MGTMAREPIDLGDTLDAELHPAGGAVLADAAAAIVVLHHALADARLLLGYTLPDRDDDTARLMAGDHRTAIAEPKRRRGALPFRGAIEFQVAAAHAGGLDLQHDLARARRGIGELAQLELAPAQKDNSLHGALPR